MANSLDSSAHSSTSATSPQSLAGPSTPSASENSSTPQYFPFTNIQRPSHSIITDPVERFLAKFPPAEPRKPKRPLSKTQCGRPRKDERELKRPRHNPRTKPTKLRRSRPVVTDIPGDIWYAIFIYTEPKTLLALKTTCKLFRNILSEEGLWRRNRHHHFGIDSPPPPLLRNRLELSGNEMNAGMMTIEQYNLTKKGSLRMKESDYMELLEGRGCMVCGNKKANRTQWTFSRRWCISCYKTLVVQANEMRSVQDHYADLLKLIPRAWNDTWGGYFCLCDDFNMPRNSNMQDAYKRSDVARIIGEWEEMASRPEYHEAADEDKEMIYNAWKESKAKQHEDYKSSVKDIENFFSLIKQMDLGEQAEERVVVKIRRERFFTDKAAHLDPPLSPKSFSLIPGYKELMKGTHEPTERAWKCFLPKIEKHRRAAEDQSYKQSAGDITGHSCKLRYAEADEKRKDNSVPRQLLFNLADEAIEELRANKTAAEDFTYLFLRSVRDRYLQSKNKPKARPWDILNPGTNNTYTLCMMDAYQVYKKKLVPVIHSWTAIDKNKGMYHKCPACVRADYSKNWPLRSLLIHLRKKHGPTFDSDFADWHNATLKYLEPGAYRLFPWYAIEWPRNFPILAPHHAATGHWDPDEENYTTAPSSTIKATVPAFSGRSVKLAPAPEAGTLFSEDMANSLVFASHKLNDLPIDIKFKNLMIWKFAIENLNQFHTRQGPLSAESNDQEHAGPDNNTLYELSLALIRRDESTILQGLSCVKCANSTNHATPRLINSKFTFDEMVGHWKYRHVSGHRPPRTRWTQPANTESPMPSSPRMARRDGQLQACPIENDMDWRKHMLLLPSELELADALTEDGMEETREAFNELFPLQDPDAEGINSMSSASSSTARHASRTAVNGLEVLADEAAKAHQF